jgi:membrane protein implicated in regulation of membrane protease activity
MEILDNLDGLLKAFWWVAIPASLIFLIQTIMTFIGADAADGTQADFDGDLSGADTPFQLFSFRNLINFLLGFSWSGISLYNTISNKTWLVLVALAIGSLFVYVFFAIIKQVQKLAEDNSFKIEDTVGKTAEVYLAIPASKQGKGKVLVSVKGSVHELPAITEGDKINSGALVRIVKTSSDNILTVENL